MAIFYLIPKIYKVVKNVPMLQNMYILFIYFIFRIRLANMLNNNSIVATSCWVFCLIFPLKDLKQILNKDIFREAKLLKILGLVFLTKKSKLSEF